MYGHGDSAMNLENATKTRKTFEDFLACFNNITGAGADGHARRAVEAAEMV